MNPTPFETESLILLYYFCYKEDVRTRFRLLRINKEQHADCRLRTSFPYLNKSQSELQSLWDVETDCQYKDWKKVCP